MKVGATLSLISLRMNASRDRIIDIRKASQLLYVHSLSFMKEFLQMDVKAAKEVLKRMIEETLKEKRKVNSQESSIFNKIYCFFSNNDKNGGDNEVVLKKLENHGAKLSMMRERERERKKRKEEEEWKERVQRGPLRNEMRGEEDEKKRHRGNDDDQRNDSDEKKRYKDNNDDQRNDADQSNIVDDEKSSNMDDNNDMNNQKSPNFVDDSVKASFDCLDHVKGEDSSFINNHVDGLMNNQVRNVDGSNMIQDNVHDSSHDALCKGIKNTHTLTSHIINDKMHQNDKNKRDVHHLEIKTS